MEKAYHAKDYQAAAVQVPPQQARGGVVVLQVTERKVGRLRVNGARYVTRDIVALNQLGNRQITPSLRAGAERGTVDVDLTVKDKLPLHGTIDLNNRYSADTSPLTKRHGEL